MLVEHENSICNKCSNRTNVWSSGKKHILCMVIPGVLPFMPGMEACEKYSADYPVEPLNSKDSEEELCSDGCPWMQGGVS